MLVIDCLCIYRGRPIAFFASKVDRKPMPNAFCPNGTFRTLCYKFIWRLWVLVRKRSANCNRTMLDSVLAGQCCVHARAIARIPNGPNSVIIIVSNPGQELCFQNASVAYSEARNQTVSIDQGHLEAICVAMQ